MEHVLSVYAEPYDAARPVVSFDERPCALVGEAYDVLPMRVGAEARQDHEYTRGGLCSLMMAFEPLRGYRQAWIRPQRRRVEFAEVVRELLDETYPDAERVRLVCDKLNTHGPSSLYARFAPAEARRLAARIEWVYTPVHGSWLGGWTPAHVVECELSVFVGQCLGHRRLGTIEALTREVGAWVAARNAAGATVQWHFTTDDARRKLTRLYPSV